MDPACSAIRIRANPSEEQRGLIIMNPGKQKNTLQIADFINFLTKTVLSVSNEK